MADAVNMAPNETSADFCRRMGWQPGDKIESPTDGAHSVLEIVALHDHVLQAREVRRNGKALLRPQVHHWTLSYRAWRRAQ